MPLVSVLMTAYNRQDLIGQSIRTVQNQTFRDWELIILDDASTDKTVDVCRAFEAEDKRIQVLSNKQNLGLGENRKLLMTMGSGKYIASHDSDDLSTPQRLQWAVEVLENRPEIGLVSGVVEFLDDADGVLGYYPRSLHRGEQYPQDKKKMVEWLYSDCVVQIGASTFRRDLTRFFPGKYPVADDWYFMVHAAHHVPFWGIPEVVLKVRRGQHHNHLWKDMNSQIEGARHFLWNAFQHYKDDPDSPIDYRLYRKCLAKWLAKRGMQTGGIRGYSDLLQAVWCDPSNKVHWKSLRNLSRRALRKAKRIAVGEAI